MADIRLTLPWPPAALWPNPPAGHMARYRAAWGTRRRPMDGYATSAYFLAVAERNLLNWQTADKATIHILCVRGDQRPFPDDDNLIAALKPVRDALSAPVFGRAGLRAGIYVDDSPEHLRLLPVTFERGPESLIVLTVVRLEEMKE